MGKLTSAKPSTNDSSSNKSSGAKTKLAQHNSSDHKMNQLKKRFQRRQVSTIVSASMTAALNDAAETARLVLDHHANEDNNSVASHASFSSTRSIPSQRLGSDDGMSLSGGEEDDIMGMDNSTITVTHQNLNLGSSSHSMMDDSSKLKVPNSTSLDASFVSTSTLDIPGSSPPPAAFSNLPMSRGFPTAPHNSKNNGEEDGDEDDAVLAEGKVVEVSNHFDAAAAISAALASSHLAQATGGVGELQLPLSQHHLSYKPTPNRRRRRTVSDYSSEDDLEAALTQKPCRPKHRRSASDGVSNFGSNSDLYYLATETSTPSNTKMSANDKMKVYKRTSSSETYNVVKKGLPTPEEAAAEMRKRRSSYTSLDESDRTGVKQKTDDKVSATDAMQQSESAGEKKKTNGQRKSLKKNEAGLKGNSSDGKRVSQLSDDSVSFCSSSGYENESNTSSYGSNTNTFGSTISPITMTGFSSEEGKQSKQNGGSNKEGGVLGNLRQTSAYKSIASDNSYDTVSCDEEYSMHCGDDAGLLGKNTAMLQQNNSKKPKSVRIASSAEVISSTSSPAFVKIETQKAHVPLSETKEQDENAAAKPSAPPASANQRHVSLFESFDRNWAQAVRGKPNPQLELGLGKKCLASFATLFETKKSIGDKRSPSFRWWDDNNAFASNEGDIETSMAKENGSDENPMIPIPVVRMVWKACFFESNESFDSEQIIDLTLDSIQQTLVNTLCYLEKVDTPTYSCFRLSLGAYTDYGRYILRQLQIENQVTSWHGKLSRSLQIVLLQNKSNGEDGEFCT